MTMAETNQTPTEEAAIDGASQVISSKSRTAMKAIRIHRFGGSDVLELDDVPVPQQGENELLVRIHAASVNPVDYKIRVGLVP
jgi:NADPH-dependent curcumin reductase CurA